MIGKCVKTSSGEGVDEEICPNASRKDDGREGEVDQVAEVEFAEPG